jgi:hypothetical protein
MLSGQHPHRFNRLGAARWTGFVYGGPRILPRLLRPVVYHGPMGTAPFQSEQRDRTALAVMWATAMVPLVVFVAIVTLPLALVTRMFLAVPAGALLLLVGFAVCVAASTTPAPGEAFWRIRMLVGVLHVLQPIARMWGRLRGKPLPPRERTEQCWTGSREDWLLALQHDLSSRWCAVRQGLTQDSWDLEVRVGPALRCRVHTAVTWGWNPVARRSWSLTIPATVVIVASAVALAVAPPEAALVLAALVTSTIAEAAVLLRLSSRALAHTTGAVRENP